MRGIAAQKLDFLKQVKRWFDCRRLAGMVRNHDAAIPKQCHRYWVGYSYWVGSRHIFVFLEIDLLSTSIH